MAVTVDAKCAADTEINSVVGTTGFTSTNLTVGATATALFACLVFDGSANLTTVTAPRRLGHRQIRRSMLEQARAAAKTFDGQEWVPLALVINLLSARE
jgi:hypothetical protein